MKGAYYNDNDPFCAEWLRRLIAAGVIPAGEVDERSIADVDPSDLRGFAHVHFFAGIGGWAYALQLAGWDMDRPLWTGSCPCQPFSSAGRQGGALDERHLWPRWLRLIRECRPDAILGEQVEGAVGFGWIDRVFADLEAEGYACGAAVLGAHSVGAPHIRQRLFWVADAGKPRHQSDARGLGSRESPKDGAGHSFAAMPLDRLRWAGERAERGEEALAQQLAGRDRTDGSMAHPDAARSEGRLRGGPDTEQQDLNRHAGRDGAAGGVADAEHAERGALGGHRSDGRDGANGGRQEAHCELGARGEVRGFWDDAVWLPCLDGKARRVVAAVQPLAHAGECICGLRLGELCACGERRPSRVGMLRGSGNAIAPAVAAEFIRAVLDCIP